MPVDKFANMEEKLWILEDLNMMYIRQIALSLQVKMYLTLHYSSLALFALTVLCCCVFVTIFVQIVKKRSLSVREPNSVTFFFLIVSVLLI